MSSQYLVMYCFPTINKLWEIGLGMWQHWNVISPQKENDSSDDEHRKLERRVCTIYNNTLKHDTLLDKDNIYYGYHWVDFLQKERRWRWWHMTDRERESMKICLANWLVHQRKHRDRWFHWAGYKGHSCMLIGSPDRGNPIMMDDFKALCLLGNPTEIDSIITKTMFTVIEYVSMPATLKVNTIRFILI